MDLSIGMRVTYNVKHRYAICLKFGDELLISLTKIVLEANVSVCSIKKKSTFILS